eukprot:PhM_4_TR15869/c0_g1_i1/m.28019/K13703/ABHD11; abhydrolase domain-containing protein 11
MNVSGLVLPRTVYSPRAPSSRTLPQLPPIVVLHGLFGSARSWSSMARTLSDATQRRVHAVDLRDHATSVYSTTDDGFTLDACSDDLARTVEAVKREDKTEKVVLMAHSLGGTILMHALRQRDHSVSLHSAIERAIFVDILPKAMTDVRRADFLTNIDAMLSLCDNRLRGEVSLGHKRYVLSTSASRKEVNRILQPRIPDDGMRGFLCNTLDQQQEQQPSYYYWRCNLYALRHALACKSMVWDASSSSLPLIATPSYFIFGSKSHYAIPEREDVVKSIFDTKEVAVSFDTIAGASHWPQYDAPKEFAKLVTAHLAS